ncbi:MAG: hypothetical protein M0036_24175 [Desulfobacteraceae bacterium]|nr:hypothetical protein [Desulfobacteraceae bacterium]
MKRIIILFSILLLSLGYTGAALAAEHDHGGHGAMAGETSPAQGDGHGSMQMGSGHEGMQMGGGMIMLESVTVDGIQAMAHLMGLQQGGGQAPTGATHNFMVAFEAQGKTVTQGRVAVKVTGPDGQTGKAVTLTPKDGFFRGDIELKTPGKYTFVVGTKIVDDKARQFSFNYELK